MFGIQFPVSAGRCTKGAYLQLIPVSLENDKNNAILVVDTEGLGAPEYKNNNTHDNEIATFVLGISDIAILNVRGELPNDIENFLEVSICALMRMDMVDFHPNVVFVHQNCDPSAKEKNISGRNTFMKQMDEVVVAQADIMQKRYRYFQDTVDISLENDIFYFPQLMEGSGSMAPPSEFYSEACSELRDHILTKILSSKTKSKSLEDFCNKIELVWNGILEENFVLSLNNNAEIQVKYEIENEISIWRSKLECSLNENLEIVYNEIISFFRSNFEETACKEYLSLKSYDFWAKSIELNNAQAEAFAKFIDKKTVNQTIFQKWKQRYINRMEQIHFNFVKNCEGCIEKCFTDQLNC
ncbi:interferon-induced very large GTPase 1-like [Hydra vulgaris]|uniref:Interferon-induced very large GTPase 1-like n=1 Tax=Hydra vulgaris TaxID=6087 RepID=A0ABM4B3E0_HYDVU